jgi:hypothetical protein
MCSLVVAEFTSDGGYSTVAGHNSETAGDCAADSTDTVVNYGESYASALGTAVFPDTACVVPGVCDDCAFTQAAATVSVTSSACVGVVCSTHCRHSFHPVERGCHTSDCLLVPQVL